MTQIKKVLSAIFCFLKMSLLKLLKGIGNGLKFIILKSCQFVINQFGKQEIKKEILSHEETEEKRQKELEIKKMELQKKIETKEKKRLEKEQRKKEKEELAQVKEQVDKKHKKNPTLNVGSRKKRVTALWILLISSSAFGIYRNFSAINTHTIYNETRVESRIQNTSAIENFVIRFARVFYTYSDDSKVQSEREEMLQQFLTDELIRLHADKLLSDIPTTSTVEEVYIWDVNPIDEFNYQIIFSVEQRIKSVEFNDQLETAYQVTVHVDENNDMVITSLTFSQKPDTSNFVPETLKGNGLIDVEVRNEVFEFLELFFELYPSMTEQQLAFYAQNESLPVLERELEFVRLINPLIVSESEILIVEVTVEYLCQKTLTKQKSNYLFSIEKVNDNWQIVK